MMRTARLAGCRRFLSAGAVFLAVCHMATILPSSSGLADEFDAAAKPAAADKTAADTKPPAGAKPPVGAKAKAAAQAEQPPSPEETAQAIATIVHDPNEDPLVRTLLEAKPTTPAELVRAIKVLVDIHRAPVAKLLVAPLVATQPAPPDMDQLLEQFGSATFIDLAGTPQLGPDMGKFVESLLRDAQQYREDPQRLAKMVAGLRSNQLRTRQEAVAQLIRAHSAAVMPLVRVLADPARAGEHAGARQMLVDLGGDAIGPVTAALGTGDPALRLQIVEVLGRLGDRQPLYGLLRPAVDPAAQPELRAAAERALVGITGSAVTLLEARAALEREITRRLAYAVAHSGETTPTMEFWAWDAAKNESVLRTAAVSVHAADQAAALARDLLALGPQDVATRELCLTALLTAARLDQDLDTPLPMGPGTAHDLAAAQGMDTVESVLAGALAAKNYAAAQSAVEILGQIGKPALLTHFGQRPAPLALAAASGDRRVRFAALEVVLKLAPNTRFPGASTVVDDLQYFAATSGMPRVLIGHPRTEAAQVLAGFLADLGYEADVATNGRKLLAQAFQSPDYDLILVHFNLPGTQVDDVLAGLRRDARTARLPVGVFAEQDRVSWAQRLAGEVPLAAGFLEPPTAATMKFRVDELLSLVGRHQVPFERRQQWAGVALDQIARLAETPRDSIFDLRPLVSVVERALLVPALQSRAAPALANLGTVAGQYALLEVANRGTQPIAAREAAAAAFRRSVARHGILLTQPQITRQYALYNASAPLDPAVQQVFGSILDTLERRDGSDAQAR